MLSQFLAQFLIYCISWSFNMHHIYALWKKNRLAVSSTFHTKAFRMLIQKFDQTDFEK